MAAACQAAYCRGRIRSVRCQGSRGGRDREGRWAVAEQAGLSFAGLLRQLRAEARLTQEALAEAAAPLSPQSVAEGPAVSFAGVLRQPRAEAQLTRRNWRRRALSPGRQ